MTGERARFDAEHAVTKPPPRQPKAGRCFRSSATPPGIDRPGGEGGRGRGRGGGAGGAGGGGGGRRGKRRRREERRQENKHDQSPLAPNTKSTPLARNLATTFLEKTDDVCSVCSTERRVMRVSTRMKELSHQRHIPSEGCLGSSLSQANNGSNHADSQRQICISTLLLRRRRLLLLLAY